MRVILDTNVLMSGIFFAGPPSRILEAWGDGKLRFVLSKDIFEEYRRVEAELAAEYSGVDAALILELLAAHSQICDALPLPESVCADPEDDKFLACALASRCKLIISGDAHLLKASGYRGIVVVRPGKFVEEYLSDS